jgi:catechol 1,2-dioxygenase
MASVHGRHRVEHVVEEVATEHREGSKGSIEGPTTLPSSPLLGAECTLPMREDEPGTLLFQDKLPTSPATHCPAPDRTLACR